MKLTVRPLTDRAFIGAAPRERSKFTATWTNTLDLLEREVYTLQTHGMDDPVLMVDCTEQDIRLDGQLRANASLATNAVAIAFESRRGPLMFRCDRYNARPYARDGMQRLWQHNVRAIALTLEALRAVDRYGATSSGEQYVGYRQIEAKSAAAMTREQAIAVFAQQANLRPEHLNTDPHSLLHVFRVARRKAHPDMATGSRAQWDLVEQAARVLGVAD